ncbi:hypothetical protein [Cronobacter dublinensis]|uniref:hypothetical protein n=1 Tax=Cronobacter dublinensis TaxID=413497 RepID=UPI0018F86FC0|nr:hypothetical protein [Cronobacter dublinensis]
MTTKPGSKRNLFARPPQRRRQVSVTRALLEPPMTAQTPPRQDDRRKAWQLTSDHKPRENVTRNRSQNRLAGLRERVEVKMINQHMMNKARRAAREALTKRNARKWDEANRIMRQAAASAFH